MKKIIFYELALETVGQWPKSVKTALCFSMGCLIIILGYCCLVQSNCEYYKQLHAQEAVLKVEFENRQLRMENVKEHQSQLNELSKRFRSLLNQFTVKNEMPQILQKISTVGTRSGLRFFLFAPQSEFTHSFYVVMPIKIVVEGNYFQLARFLSRIAHMKQIITFGDFKIEKKPQSNYQVASQDRLVMNITIKIYRYRV